MASGLKKYGFDESRFDKAVSPNLICSVCLNVVKDPKMCTNHEHVFCSDCITEHLGNASTCPQCMDPLTVETLKRPPRLFLNFLSELKIKCDHYNRGCRQYVRLEELPSHAMNCDFAPVLCSNKDCGMEINKRDRIYHETQVCEYSHKCHDCTKVRREMNEMKINMAEVKRNVVELKTELAETLGKVNSDLTEIMKTSLAGVKEELLKELRATTGEISRHLNVTQLSPRVQPAVEQDDIIIAGGLGSSGKLCSVEIFSWRTRSWASLPPLREPRKCATSFVYNNQIFVAGGHTIGLTDAVEMIAIDVEPVQWETFPAKIPIKICDHQTVVYQNCLIVVGGWESHGRRSDAIYEVLLSPPYSTKRLKRMPERRDEHGAELVNDKVFILGGYTKGITDSVLMYDVVRNECKRMPSLLYAVKGMSTVSWRNKVILLGGRDENGRSLNDVLMYDTVTGYNEVLPCMKHKRKGSSAVVTGNSIIVMAGQSNEGYLNSVECYNFSSNSWQELPPMIEKRAWATAVVKPVKTC